VCHPNVANVHEFDEADGTSFIVMELVSGQTLAERIVAGWSVDARTDVWSFGCVLYEMLVGRPAFAAASAADTIAAVVKGEPDWSALPPETPPGMRRLLRHCVQPDPRAHLRAIADARLDLEETPDVAWSGRTAPRRSIPRPATGRDILLIALGGARERRPYLESAAEESSPQFSPDGRALAYVSNQSGRNEVYVQPSSGGGALRVSVNGGSEPVWARDGGELFYREGDRMMAARVATDPGGPRVSAPVLLFTGDFARGTLDSPNFDVTADGRFIMLQRQGVEEALTALQVLLDWQPGAAERSRR
jgi:dipeptidyl aminopeptidase/acylaminoacyl peptidase